MPDNRAVKILDNAIKAGRLHHAVLLYGSSLHPLEEAAKETATKLFGRTWVNHPDLFELRPEGKMRQIKIGSPDGEPEPNTMRRLLKSLRQTSALGVHKVAIIYEADRMNQVTANAFLKTLEEPPAQTTLFILSTRPNDILETIRSRCVALRVDCPDDKIDNPDWQTWLADYSAWQKSLAGGIGRAISLGDAMMQCYGLLARFETLIAQILEEETSIDNSKEENLDEEMIEAVQAGERRAIRKRMFADIENACVACALGGNGVPAVKISRVVEALEKASGLTELNMADTIALEYFMITSLRIWTR